MRRITSLTGLALALLFMFGTERTARAQKERSVGMPGPSWVVCWTQGASTSTDRGIRTTTYLSGVVRIPDPVYSQDVGKAFDKYIESKGVLPPGAHSTSQCVAAPSEAEAQMVIQRTQAGTTNAPGTRKIVDCSRWNTQCIMTDWTSMPVSPAADTTNRPPAPAQVAASPTPTAAPVASAAVNPPPRASNQPAKGAVTAPPVVPQTPYAICWGQLNGHKTTAYFSAPFAASARNVPAWSAAYKEFLGNKYKFAGVVHCPILKSLAEAQERIQQLEEQMTHSRWKIIETAWKNE